MFVQEFGPDDAPVMLALHPMGITGENLYEALAPHLTGSFHVIAPDQGGHGKSGHYVSLGDEVSTLKDYLKGNGYQHFALLYGASMGVTAAYELLKDPDLHFDKIWFDGAGFAQGGPSYTGAVALATKAALGVIRVFPSLLEKNFAKTYGPHFAHIMRENFMHFNNDDVIGIFRSFGSLSLVPLPDDVLSNLHLEWGEEDGIYDQSASALETYFPGVPVLRRPGYGHCGFMANRTEDYVHELEAFASN